MDPAINFWRGGIKDGSKNFQMKCKFLGVYCFLRSKLVVNTFKEGGENVFHLIFIYISHGLPFSCLP